MSTKGAKRRQKKFLPNERPAHCTYILRKTRQMAGDVVLSRKKKLNSCHTPFVTDQVYLLADSDPRVAVPAYRNLATIQNH